MEQDSSTSTSTSTSTSARRRDGLGRIAARGAIVTLGGQAARIAMQMASIAILARLIDPESYGLVAMVMVVVSLGEVFREFGLSAAAVQSPTLTKGQRNNLFWVNTGAGVALASAGFATAGIVASFYREPAVAPIMQALSAIFLINGVSAQYRASLTRDLRFRALAVIDVGAQAIATGCGIALAIRGFEYWALVGLQVVQASASLLLLLLRARWLPGLPRRGQDMSHFWTYGWNLLGSQLIGFATNNVDSLVIGRRFGAGSLGTYDRAYRIVMVPLSQIKTPTTTVALPILSRLSGDPVRFAEFLVLGQLALGYTVVAALAFAAGAADPLVAIFLGSSWDASAPYFALLAGAGALQMLSYVGYWVYLARGLTRRLFSFSLISAAVRIGCILAGSQFGVIGVAWGVFLAPVILWPLSLFWLSRVTVVPVRSLLWGGARIMSMAAVCAVAVRIVVVLLGPVHSLVALTVGGVTALAVYAVLGWLIPTIRQDERAVIATVDLARRRQP